MWHSTKLVWRAVLVTGLICCVEAHGQDEPDPPAAQVLTSTKWQVLHAPGRFLRKTLPLPKEYPLVPLSELTFTGPRPAHPFVLGDFAADGEWRIVNGYVQLHSGKNAALQLGVADQFELEGVMHLSGYGGWFLLVGWDQGRGFAVHNVMLKESGSPWFISSFRGYRAVDGGTKEFRKFGWKDEQPFRLRVEDGQLTLHVGKFTPLDAEPLDGYAPGAVVIGVYDTNYGPRPLRIRSLRIRALEPKGPEPNEM